MKLWSHFFIPTLKESPADAEITSHKLLLRAGLVRKLSGGLYTYLPLGLRALQKITQICREEMDAAGAIELSIMPGTSSRDGTRRSTPSGPITRAATAPSTAIRSAADRARLRARLSR